MKIGFIGCGNMGQAMMWGMLSSGKLKTSEVLVSTKTVTSKENLQRKYGVMVADKNIEVAMLANIIFLAVKPQYYEEVIEEIKPALGENKILVSIAPGKSLEWLEEKVGRRIKIIRAMPNTPSMVKEGMTGLCGNDLVTASEFDTICKLFSTFSRAEIVPEHLMDTVTAVSGSAPAYVFMFIEAMADAAVAGGMPRKQAYTFAAQAVLGSAKMVLETGKHPGELKDMVCSPGGTTIQAVRVLEEGGMRSSVIEAMMKCLDISRKM